MFKKDYKKNIQEIEKIIKFELFLNFDEKIFIFYAPFFLKKIHMKLNISFIQFFDDFSLFNHVIMSHKNIQILLKAVHRTVLYLLIELLSFLKFHLYSTLFHIKNVLYNINNNCIIIYVNDTKVFRYEMLIAAKIFCD